MGQALRKTDEPSYSTEFRPKARTRDATFTVSLPNGAPGSFTVRRLTFADRFFNAIGFSARIRSGDAAFDARYYVESETPKLAAAFFSASAPRAAAVTLLELGFTEVKKTSDALQAVQDKAPSALPPETVEKAAACLEQLTQGLGEAFRAGLDPAARRALAVRQVIFLGAALAAVGGIALAMLANWLYPIVGEAFFFWRPPRIALGVAAFFLVAGAVVLRGRPSSHRELGFLAFLLGIGFPLLGDGLVTFYNGAFDRSGLSSTHEVPVLEKQEYRTRSFYGLMPDFYVRVQSWRRDRAFVSLKTNNYDFRRTTPGSTRYRVVTKPGTLGYEWVKSQEFLSP